MIMSPSIDLISRLIMRLAVESSKTRSSFKTVDLAPNMKPNISEMTDKVLFTLRWGHPFRLLAAVIVFR